MKDTTATTANAFTLNISASADAPDCRQSVLHHWTSAEMCARCDEFLALSGERLTRIMSDLRTEAAAKVKDFSPDIARLERGLQAKQNAVREGRWHSEIWAAHDAAVAVEAARDAVKEAAE
jgi:hypothetical protein